MKTRTKIEWCDYSINPVKGLCPVGCEYCYARRLYKRFKWNPKIRYDKSTLQAIGKIRPGSKIFIGSTVELFGEWVKPEWLTEIFDYASWFKDRNFIFLTKRPENLAKWSFPPNCWVGVSVPEPKGFGTAIYYLQKVEATVKFISFEPLLARFTYEPWRLEAYLRDAGISWVIIGQQTPVSAKTAPKKIWIDEIITAAQKAGIPYFLKNNLKTIMGDSLMQQFPKVLSEGVK